MEYDFDLSDVIKNAVTLSEEKPYLRVNSPPKTAACNLKYPCGICHKSEGYFLYSLFDLFRITDTKEQIGKGFTTNINIDEYHLYTQPTKSAAGSVAIYANNKLDNFERNDLGILHEECESIWVEMKKVCSDCSASTS